MRDRSKSLKVVAMMLFASSVIIGCGHSESSPLSNMQAPIHVVRNDSVVEVKDSAGKVYVLNSLERTDYRAALLKPGDELALSTTR